MKTTLPIAQGFYQSESLPLSAQRCVNFVPSVPQTSTVTDANLFGVSGIEKAITGSEIENCRGAHVLGDTPYFVIENKLLRLNLDSSSGSDVFSVVELGDIEGASRVFMADNGTQLCITAPPDLSTNGKSYIFTESPDTLTEITDSNFDGAASSVIYIDGYFVFHKSDGKKFFNSPLNEGLTGYDPLDFNVAEADPDQIRGLGRISNQLYVFGSETTQIFRNIGRAPSPFAPIAGAVLDVGAVSPQSIVRYASGLAFVGGGTNQEPSVWLISGTQKQRLSTKAIDNELSKVVNPETIYSWVYSEGGADFLGISTTDTCFVYDIINGRWHERRSYVNGKESAYRVSHMVTAYDRVLVGDTVSGNIGFISENSYTEYGNLVRRVVTSRPFDNLGNYSRVISIEAVIESGVGLANDIKLTTDSGVQSIGGSDPQITLYWSDDGGRKFVGGISKSMGKTGEFDKRPIWYRLGSFSRQRVLKFEVSSPTKAVIIKVEADIG